MPTARDARDRFLGRGNKVITMEMLGMRTAIPGDWQS